MDPKRIIDGIELEDVEEVSEQTIHELTGNKGEDDEDE